MTTDLDALIAKLEEATRPSQELDLEIWKFLNPEAIEIQGIWSSGNTQFVAHHTDYSKNRYEKALSVCTGHIREANYLKHRELLPFTRSIDAALTLVPKGMSYELHVDGSPSGPRAISSVWSNLDGDYKSEARFPALALSAAALRARQSGEVQA